MEHHGWSSAALRAISLSAQQFRQLGEVCRHGIFNDY